MRPPPPHAATCVAYLPSATFHRDLHADLKADYVIANPPFNDSDWGGDRLRDDVRWKYGPPPARNANFAWVQHFLHHLTPTGQAGFVLANGSMSSNQSGEGEIRKAIVEGRFRAAGRPAVRLLAADHSLAFSGRNRSRSSLLVRVPELTGVPGRTPPVQG